MIDTLLILTHANTGHSVRDTVGVVSRVEIAVQNGTPESSLLLYIGAILVPILTILGWVVAHRSMITAQRRHHHSTEMYNAWIGVERALQRYEGWLRQLTRLLIQHGPAEGLQEITAQLGRDDGRLWRAELEVFGEFFPGTLTGMDNIEASDAMSRIYAALAQMHKVAKDEDDVAAALKSCLMAVSSCQNGLQRNRPRWRREVHQALWAERPSWWQGQWRRLKNEKMTNGTQSSRDHQGPGEGSASVD